ncbi:MAG TPA: TlpA disulfide reductase family protein [Anaeromyxobacteraceae bacterium]|nr:TlpA disulfide reductase family protein [Anaeromyxobacteraceae bacterium]
MRPTVRAFAPLLLALAAGCAGGRPVLVASPLVGKPAEVAAPNLSGAEVRVSDARGTVRVVDFWATWCEPCREQLPALDRLSRAYVEQGLRVYAVAMDEDRSLVKAYLEATPVAFEVLWDKGGARHGERLDVQRLPTTLVLDRAGTVRFVHQGYVPRNAELLEEEVKTLLAEPVP